MLQFLCRFYEYVKNLVLIHDKSQTGMVHDAVVTPIGHDFFRRQGLYPGETAHGIREAGPRPQSIQAWIYRSFQVDVPA